jgi:hypothetical protein
MGAVLHALRDINDRGLPLCALRAHFAGLSRGGLATLSSARFGRKTLAGAASRCCGWRRYWRRNCAARGSVRAAGAVKRP